jgi:hypothetical protein
MIPTLGETLLALAGLWRFAREGAPALRWFDRSLGGFWRSFGVMFILVPLQILLVALQVKAAPVDAAGWVRLVVIEGSAYVIQWLALPVILYEVAARLQRLPSYLDFVIVYNWTGVPVQTLSVVLALLGSSKLIDDTAVLVLALIVEIATLAFEWYTARQTLRFSGLACAALVLVDFSIAVTVEDFVAGLT